MKMKFESMKVLIPNGWPESAKDEDGGYSPGEKYPRVYINGKEVSNVRDLTLFIAPFSCNCSFKHVTHDDQNKIIAEYDISGPCVCEVLK